MTGADAKCQALASAVHLDGTYLAWLSGATGSPSSRFSQSATPYRLVDGTVVASDWTEFTSGSLQHAIDQDESGRNASTNRQAWIDTKPDGTIADANGDCGGWLNGTPNDQSGLGNLTLSDGRWTQDGVTGCDSLSRLYCFQQKGSG